jgi:hypothetical protein
MYVSYAVMMNGAKNVRIGGTFSNFADSTSRTISIQYSLNGGGNWQTGASQSMGSSSGTFIDFTLNLTQERDHLGLVLIRYVITAANTLIGLNRVYIETIGSSAGPSILPRYIEDDHIKFLDPSTDPKYYYRRGWIMYSSFTNPTQNILTVNSSAANHILSADVKVHQVRYTTAGGSAIFEGMAEYRGGGTNSAATMTKSRDVGSVSWTVPTLSWSGNTLQLTGYRQSNYCRYYVTVEVAENNNVNWDWNINYI